MRSILACGQHSKNTNKPGITKTIHWSLQDNAWTLSKFAGHNAIFKVTRGLNEVDFGLRNKFQENQ